MRSRTRSAISNDCRLTAASTVTLSKVLSNDPLAPEPFYARGTSYLAISKFKEALEDFNSSLQLNNKNAAAWTGRGLAQEGLGERQKARESLQRALQINPGYAPAKEALARNPAQTG